MLHHLSLGNRTKFELMMPENKENEDSIFISTVLLQTVLKISRFIFKIDENDIHQSRL